jgi:hypothetical protein
MTAAQALCKYSQSHWQFFFSLVMSVCQLYSTLLFEISFLKDRSFLTCRLPAAAHPWLRDQHGQIPLDMLVFKLVKAYLRSTPLKRAALKVDILVSLSI